MHAFIKKRMPIFTIVPALLCTLTAPPLLQAEDEKDKSTPSAKAASAKPKAPAPGLTERERMLLDRVEQLEKRVAELETKGVPSTAPAAEVVASQPDSADGASVSAATITSGETAAPVAHGASTNVIPADKAIASVTEQATEKGKSGAAKAPASDPFAFADFTWLNGNARTKESPMDTKFFTPEIRADVGAFPAASLAGEPRLDIGQPDVIRPSVAADWCPVAAFVVRAIDQETANA